MNKLNKYKEKCILVGRNENLFERYHELTSLSINSKHKFDISISGAFDDKSFMNSLVNKKKEINEQGKIIKLLSNVEIEEIMSIFKERKSTRYFMDVPIPLERFATLMHYSYSNNLNGSLTVPSAGGIYPISLLVIVNNISQIDNGIYEYCPWTCSINKISNEKFNINYGKVTSSESLTVNCAFSIHFIGTPENTCYKYQDRGYRFLNIECGHIAQNFSLISTFLSMGSVCSGGFLDGEFFDYLNKNTSKRFENYLYLYEMYFGFEA